MKNILLIALLLFSGAIYAQNVGIGTSNPDGSAILDLKSNNKGFLLPRLTEKQKNLIPTPAEGLMIYQTDANKQGVYLFQSGSWKNISSDMISPSNNTANSITTYTSNYLLAGNGTSTPVSSSVFVNPTNGNVGIGNTAPGSDKLQVTGNASMSNTINSRFVITQRNNLQANYISQFTLVNGSTFYGANDRSWQVANVGLNSTSSSLDFQYWNGSSYLLPFRILPSGRTLIGGPVPSDDGISALQVAGDISSVNSNGNAKMVIRQNGNLRANTISQFILSNGSTFYGANDRSWQVANVGLNSTSSSIDFQYWNGSSYLLPFRILPSGRTLIGGPIPSDDGISALQVSGSVRQTSVTSALLKADETGKLVAAPITEEAVNNGAGVKVNTKSTGYLAVGDFGAATPMNIPAGYRLVVQDGILTEKIKVAIRNQTDWADYVFEPTYSLMPLSEVEKFIKKNRHLPNVPSAGAMVEKGIEVGHTSKIFMEKIEELTLYMIEMKKEIESLKVENAKLKNN